MVKKLHYEIVVIVVTVILVSTIANGAEILTRLTSEDIISESSQEVLPLYFEADYLAAYSPTPTHTITPTVTQTLTPTNTQVPSPTSTSTPTSSAISASSPHMLVILSVFLGSLIFIRFFYR